MAHADFAHFELPCSDPERMNDWHIPERFPLPPEEERDIRTLASTQARMEYGENCTLELEEEAAAVAVGEAIEDLKQRRRKAIQSCHLDCPMKARLLCLDEGLKPINLEHGIWGAYPESARRKVADTIAARKRPMSRSTAARLIVNAEQQVVIDKAAAQPR